MTTAFTHWHSGPPYFDFVARMARAKNARGYLEVGVRDGTTLSRIDCPSIGVDPFFQITGNVIGKKTNLHLYQMTSDDFFRDYEPSRIINAPIDVIFLDGLHQFEYLLRDFINSEKVTHRHGLIMLDDCLPANAEMTERTHNQEGRANRDLAGWWTGDVWKLLPILEKYRPDLRVTAVDVRPTGSICITDLDPSSTILERNYYAILDEYRGITMDDALCARFYDGRTIVGADTILNGFEASLFVGP